MKEKVAKTSELTIYKFASISEEDIAKAGLTERQRVKPAEISKQLGISSNTV